MKWLVTTVGAGDSSVTRRLRAEGHDVTELVVGRLVALPASVPSADWLVLTSRAAVPAAVAASARFNHVAAIGAATAAVARAHGLTVDFVPTQPEGATFLRQLSARVRPTDIVVRLKARGAVDRLAGLAAHCRYCCVEVYDNLPVSIPPVDLTAYDGVYFTSPSAVERLLSVAVGVTTFRAIGPATAAALRARGYPSFRSCLDLIY